MCLMKMTVSTSSPVHRHRYANRQYEALAGCRGTALAAAEPFSIYFKDIHCLRSNYPLKRGSVQPSVLHGVSTAVHHHHIAFLSFV